MTVIITTSYSNNPGTKLTKDDVWGKYNHETHTLETQGLIVARGGICPIFGDEIPYKSVTVVCTEEQLNDVEYWLDYVHGANSLEKIAELENGELAIRSNYMAW
jgi:hypothetical protein